MPDHYEIEIRFQEAGVEDGKVDAARLAEIAGSLQELSLRLGRAITGASGVGRSTDEVKEETRLVFAGTQRGSTRLIFEGARIEPEVPLSPHVAGLSEQVMEELSPILSGDAGRWQDSRKVLESATEFLDALRDVETVELTMTSPDGKARVDAIDVVRSSTELCGLLTARAERGAEVGAVVGELYMVDARRGHFKVQGDVGPVVDVYAGSEIERAAHLILSRVRAEGVATRGPGGRVDRLDDATIMPLDSADDLYGFLVPTDVEALLARAVPFDAGAGGIEGLDDAEIDEFLRAIGR